MEIFINEWSFKEQFYAPNIFEQAVATFLVVIERARTAIHGSQGTLWSSETLIQYPPIRGQHFLASANDISSRELKEAFLDVVFNRANASIWQPARLHRAEHQYLWLAELVSDTSIAELAERRHQDSTLKGCLINLSSSPLAGNLEITVSKEGAEPVTLSSFDNISQFEAWLTTLGGIPPYGANAVDPPRDDQTCLIDAQRYEPTSKLFQGRRIYRNRLNKDLLYVDNLHVGAAAHLEVFDKFRRHRGKGNFLDGSLMPGTRDAKKDNKIPD